MLFNCFISQINYLTFQKHISKLFEKRFFLVEKRILNLKSNKILLNLSEFRNNEILKDNSVEKFRSWLLFNGVNVYNKSTSKHQNS